MDKSFCKTANIIRTKKIDYVDEASVTSLILGFLHSLDWDVFNPYEVEPQSLVYSGKVDLALRTFGFRSVFIEIKRSTENLQKHEDQILRYLDDAPEVEMGVLTNAVSWIFYKKLEKNKISKTKEFNLKNMDNEHIWNILQLNLSKQIFLEKTMSKKANKFSMLEIEQIKHQISENEIRDIIQSNMESLNSGDVNEKLSALGCLRGFKDQEFTEIFKEIFSDTANDENVRLSALFGLWEINDKEILLPVFYEALNDNNLRVRNKVQELNSLLNLNLR